MEVTSTSASLTTVSVSLQVMQVNGKQMTLSVFRQLPELYPEVIEDLRRLNLWGFVYYKIGEEEEWFVAEMDGKLYRFTSHVHILYRDTQVALNHLEKLQMRIASEASEIESQEARREWEHLRDEYIACREWYSEAREKPQLFIAV